MKTAFDRRHPAVNFIFFVAVAVLEMLFLHPLFLAVSFCGALGYNVLLKGKKAVKMFFCFYFPLFIFVVILNTFVAHYGVTTLLTLSDGNRITLEAIVYGAVTGAVAVTMMIWFSCYSDVVTEDKFLHLFGKRMPHLALLIMMVLRFVPLYTRRLRETYSARKAAIKADGNDGFSEKIWIAASSVSGVVTRALEQSIETADSMKSRGYGLKGRTSYSRFSFSGVDRMWLASILLLFAFVLAAKLGGLSDASYNPVIAVDAISPLSTAAAAAYAVLCFMPLISELIEIMIFKSVKK